MPSMIPKRMIDITRANELLGFTPRTNISDGIEKTVRWFIDSSNK
jgi:nucleoside-diphosphate-sugar epimerase